jgi:hypothetical protein
VTARSVQVSCGELQIILMPVAHLQPFYEVYTYLDKASSSRGFALKPGSSTRHSKRQERQSR